MSHNNTITIKRFARQASLLLTLALLAFAHGGFNHVIGTVVKVENNVLTVKTVKGNVDVRLNDKTEITRNDQKAEASDLKPGTRVVVDLPEGSKDKVAHSVKVGVSKTHSPQK
jgi:apolipoprotein N-acyltransferase